MTRRFNITGTCFPDHHYMVDISDRVAQIRRMVDDNTYFCINRGRQYGKTTTLRMAAQTLSKDYTVISISFEGMSDAQFASFERLAYAFLQRLHAKSKKAVDVNLTHIAEIIERKLNKEQDKKEINTEAFSALITEMMENAQRPIVLIIDEVDQASNYEAFIRFLGFLRTKYLERWENPTFQSIILAGVYDIKNLKLKIRPEAEHAFNSPWNIAESFDADMSFNVADVEGMLREYEDDHHTGMDIHVIAQGIVDYTSGYPFLVSKLCKTIDEKALGWNNAGIVEAVKQLLYERNTFFDDVCKKLDDFPDMRQALKNILYLGERVPYNPYKRSYQIAAMFNFIANDHGAIKISSRILETWLYELFYIEDDTSGQFVSRAGVDRNMFIENGRLNVEKIMARFIVHFQDIYGDRDDKFVESEGRKYFMFYIKPIINGIGNYYIESRTRDNMRTDMIIDYLGQQYIIEMKIWRGDAYNERGEQQLLEYLDAYHLDKGYMMSFCFNKNKQPGIHTVRIGNREIVEGII